MHPASFLWSLVTLGMLVTRTAALLSSGVIFPLYIYPGDSCSGWPAVKSAIQTYTTIPFYVIINPDNGPGGTPGNQPDTNYQACIAALRTAGASAGNVRILGYVATGYGATTTTQVNSDIDTYSQWTAAYRPEGIFFDETATAAASLSIYQGFAAKVHADFGTSYIILNPGTTPDTNDYFNIADQIVTYEGTYKKFSVSGLSISTTSPASKQSIIVHTGPTQTNTTLVKQLTATTKVGSIFFTNFASGSAYSNVPADFSGFLAAVQSSQTASTKRRLAMD